MPRGQKTSEDEIFKIFISYARTNSFALTANEVGMPANTVKGIIQRNKSKKRFAELLDNKKEEFVETSTRVINKATKLLERRLDRALERESELDFIIDEIASMDEEELDEKKKRAIIAKLEAYKIISPGELARTMSLYYDKRSLAKGESTENVNIQIGLEE